MSAADIQAPAFTDENTAREAIEALMWPDGPVCPHCGSLSKIGRVEGKSARPGLYYCGECKKQFTVTIGTIFERSKVPLSKWWMAIHLMSSSKKGMSAHQMHRMLGVSYQTAWFMEHRIREAMRSDALTPMGGDGGPVEVDETFIGKRQGYEVKAGFVRHKNTVLTLVERGGEARSFHIDSAKKSEIVPIVRANIAHEAHVMTDDAYRFRTVGSEFAKHDAIGHSRGEYGYTNKEGEKINTNTVEGYYSIFKRGMKGVYQHCDEKHLHRYLAEFDFRYTNRVKRGVSDAQRAAMIVEGAKGKRLMYRRPENGSLT